MVWHNELLLLLLSISVVLSVETSIDCSDHDSCSADTACIASHCINPCEYISCGNNARCDVVSHKITCKCLDGFVGDATIKCIKVECSKNENCPDNKACNNTHCVDPCSSSMCGTNTDCNIKNHTAACTCKPNHTGNPLTGCTPECTAKTVEEICTESGTACVGGKCLNPCDYISSGNKATCEVVSHNAICKCQNDTSEMKCSKETTAGTKGAGDCPSIVEYYIPGVLILTLTIVVIYCFVLSHHAFTNHKYRFIVEYTSRIVSKQQNANSS